MTTATAVTIATDTIGAHSIICIPMQCRDSSGRITYNRIYEFILLAQHDNSYSFVIVVVAAAVVLKLDEKINKFMHLQ